MKGRDNVEQQDLNGLIKNIGQHFEACGNLPDIKKDLESNDKHHAGLDELKNLQKRNDELIDQCKVIIERYPTHSLFSLDHDLKSQVLKITELKGELDANIQLLYPNNFPKLRR